MIPNPPDRLIYYPMAHPEGDWDLQTGCGAVDLWLKTSDSVELHSWWFSKPAGRLATIFLHGNAGNITHRIAHAEAITSAGSSVLMLDDYRGCGKSQGYPTEHGLYRDADAGFDELVKRRYAPSGIIVNGESLGTAVATELAASCQCGALILEALTESSGRLAPGLRTGTGGTRHGKNSGWRFAHRPELRLQRKKLLASYGDVGFGTAGHTLLAFAIVA